MNKQGISKALLLCAGLGTRLQALTMHKPKALAEINRKTLLEIAVNKLKASGVRDIIINVHHFAEQIIRHLNANNNYGINITVSDERDLLLDTGGGLKKASWFFNETKPFFIYNVDIISDIDLGTLCNYHIESNSIATLAVRERKSNRYLMFNERNILCGWQNTQTGEEIIVRPFEVSLRKYGFSGIQVLNPEIFNFFPTEEKFSLIDLYLKAAAGAEISAYLHNDSSWFDVGSLDSLAEAEKYMSS